MLLSDRGFVLMWQQPLDIPVITVENYEKWYRLYLINPDGTVIPVPSEVMEKVGCYEHGWMIDHTFHPALLTAVACYYKGEVPATTLELVAGRWVLEHSLVKGLDYGSDTYLE